MERKSSNDAVIAMMGLLFSSPLVAMRCTIQRTPQTLKQHNRATLRMDSVALFLCIVRYFVGECFFCIQFHSSHKAKDPPWFAVLWEAWRILLLQIQVIHIELQNFFQKTLRIFFLHLKTTHRLQQNEPSFSKSEPSFSIKCAVGCNKMTCRFSKSDLSFLGQFVLPRYKHRLASIAPEIDLTTLMQGDENEFFRKRKRKRIKRKRERASKEKERQQPYG